jgi:hypothetical protein
MARNRRATQEKKSSDLVAAREQGEIVLSSGRNHCQISLRRGLKMMNQVRGALEFHFVSV